MDHRIISHMEASSATSHISSGSRSRPRRTDCNSQDEPHLLSREGVASERSHSRSRSRSRPRRAAGNYQEKPDWFSRKDVSSEKSHSRSRSRSITRRSDGPNQEEPDWFSTFPFEQLSCFEWCQHTSEKWWWWRCTEHDKWITKEHIWFKHTVRIVKKLSDLFHGTSFGNCTYNFYRALDLYSDAVSTFLVVWLHGDEWQVEESPETLLVIRDQLGVNCYFLTLSNPGRSPLGREFMWGVSYKADDER